MYATTSTSEPNNYVTYVTAIGADGTATTTTIQGMAIGAVQIGPDGTAYQTTLDYWSLPTYVTAISPTLNVCGASCAKANRGASPIASPPAMKPRRLGCNEAGSDRIAGSPDPER